MDNQNLSKWEKTRKLGKFKYILIYGVILWGIPTAVFWSFLMQYINPMDSIYYWLIPAIFTFPIGGVFYGDFTWNRFEKIYSSKSIINTKK